jgi:hypothetical protein
VVPLFHNSCFGPSVSLSEFVRWDMCTMQIHQRLLAAESDSHLLFYLCAWEGLRHQLLKQFDGVGVILKAGRYRCDISMRGTTRIFISLSFFPGTGPGKLQHTGPNHLWLAPRCKIFSVFRWSSRLSESPPCPFRIRIWSQKCSLPRAIVPRQLPHFGPDQQSPSLSSLFRSMSKTYVIGIVY